MKAKAQYLVVFGAALGLLATDRVAHAQPAHPGFAIDRFDPAVRGSAWFSLDSLSFANDLQPTFGIVSDYASKPLVHYGDGLHRRPSCRTSCMSTSVPALSAGTGYGWARTFPPVAVQQGGGTGTYNGGTYAGSNQAALGDLRLDADVRLLGENNNVFRLALGTAVYLPTGEPGQYTGTSGVRAAPRVTAAGDVGLFAYAVTLGAMNRYSQTADYAGNSMGDEVLTSASAGVHLLDNRLMIGPRSSDARRLALLRLPE